MSTNALNHHRGTGNIAPVLVCFYVLCVYILFGEVYKVVALRKGPNEFDGVRLFVSLKQFGWISNPSCLYNIIYIISYHIILSISSRLAMTVLIWWWNSLRNMMCMAGLYQNMRQTM